MLFTSQIVFTCLRVFLLTDSNHAGMEIVYYCSRMTKQRIGKIISDIDCQELFPEILSPANIWNISDYECDEEESSSNYYTGFTDYICLVI